MTALDCRANDTDIDCRKCDYYIREDKPEYCDFRGMLRDALALIKEQEAVTVVWKFAFPHCPVCGQMLPEGDAVKYCLHCGRAVKWE